MCPEINHLSSGFLYLYQLSGFFLISSEFNARRQPSEDFASSATILPHMILPFCSLDCQNHGSDIGRRGPIFATTSEGGGSLSGWQEGHGGLDGEVAGAAGGGFGDEDEAAGGDDVDPATGAGDGGDFAEFLLAEEILGWISGPEVERAGGGTHGSAAMSVATKVVLGEALAGFQVVGEGFDDEFVADGDGMMVLLAVISAGAVAIVLRGLPEEVAGGGIEGANIIADGFFVAGILEDDATLSTKEGTVLNFFGELQGLSPGFLSGFQIKGDQIGSMGFDKLGVVGSTVFNFEGLGITAFKEEGFSFGEGEAGVEEGSVFWGVLPDVAAVVAVHGK